MRTHPESPITHRNLERVIIIVRLLVRECVRALKITLKYHLFMSVTYQKSEGKSLSKGGAFCIAVALRETKQTMEKAGNNEDLVTFSCF